MWIITGILLLILGYYVFDTITRYFGSTQELYSNIAIIFVLIIIFAFLRHFTGIKSNPPIDPIVDDTILKDMEDERLNKLYSEGNRLLESKDYDDAIDVFRYIIAEFGDREAYYSLGVSLYEKGDYPEALKLFKKYINRTIPHSQLYYDAYHYAGLCYFEMGLYAQAINSFKIVLLHGEDDAEVQYNLALAYIKNGDKDQALKIYQRLEQHDTVLADSLRNELQQIAVIK